MIPVFESLSQIIIHQMVYKELDSAAKGFLDTYVGKNVKIVQDEGLYGIDPLFTTIFNDMAGHERVLYSLGSSKDRGEVYSLAYVYHMSKNDISKNKALKSIYKRYYEDVIKRHKLPHTLREYFIESEKYIV